MGALGIKTEVEFRKMLKEGLIPPAVGQFKRTHLWSNSIVQTFRKSAQELGVKERISRIGGRDLLRWTDSFDLSRDAAFKFIPRLNLDLHK